MVRGLRVLPALPAGPGPGIPRTPKEWRWRLLPLGPPWDRSALLFCMCREGTTSWNNSLTQITTRSYLALPASRTNSPAGRL